MKTKYYNHSTLSGAAVFAAALALAFGAANASARPLGVDVSNNNGTVNWSTIKSGGISFAWAKASEGVNFTDGTFSANISNGKAAGLDMGAYHFSHPELNAPSAEANYFWNIVQNTVVADSKTLMPVLDFETFSGHTGASSYSDWANQWCSSIVTKTAANGFSATPIIYTTTGEACNFDTSVAQWGAWIAQPDNGNPQSGNAWEDGGCEEWGSGVWDVWQYHWPSSAGSTISFMDLDVFNGSSLTPILVNSHTCKPVAVASPTWNLRNTLTTGGANNSFSYGNATDIPITGDWTGIGTMTPGIVRNVGGQWQWNLRNSNTGGGANISFGYGEVTPGDILICGDWDGNGTWTPGIVRTNSVGQLTWLLRNANAGGGADITFTYGLAGDIPVVGDWTGQGKITCGVVRGNTWYLKNSNSSGGADISFAYGNGTTDIPIVGDWDGNGTWTCGVVNGNTWELRNSNSTGTADFQFGYGGTGNKFLVWR